MNRGYKKNRAASKPNLSFEYAEDKVNIISLLQRKQDYIEESESSSTESMKWVGKVQSNEPSVQGFAKKSQGIDRCEVVRNTNLGYFNGEVKGGLRSESKKGLFIDESEETVVKNFEKMSKKRVSGSLGGRGELSKSMMEILRKQDFCESSKEVLKFQTRLQVLKAFRQGLSGNKGSK